MTRIGVILGKAVLNPGLLKKKVLNARVSQVFSGVKKSTTGDVMECIAKGEQKGYVIGDKFTKAGKEMFKKETADQGYKLTPKTTIGQLKKWFAEFEKKQADELKKHIEDVKEKELVSEVLRRNAQFYANGLGNPLIDIQRAKVFGLK